ncbi:uncharacterized protein [Anas acuta]|uniref:uncharacterized protein n=1 Tax=Anas acuta TaxID=28680 RepID=UPI0035C8F600
MNISHKGKGKRCAAAWPQTQAPACEAHQRAGQALLSCAHCQCTAREAAAAAAQSRRPRLFTHPMQLQRSLHFFGELQTSGWLPQLAPRLLLGPDLRKETLVLAESCRLLEKQDQEIGCLCRQQDKRTLQELMVEEQLKKEWEAQHMWAPCKAHGKRDGRERAWQKMQAEMQRLQRGCASSMALMDLKNALQLVPVEMKHQHVLIPLPPAKKAEAAPLSKSSASYQLVRSVQAGKVMEKRKEAWKITGLRRTASVLLPRLRSTHISNFISLRSAW